MCLFVCFALLCFVLVCLFVFVLFVVYFYVYYHFLSFSFLFPLWLLGFLCLLRLDFSRLLSVSVVLSCVVCSFGGGFCSLVAVCCNMLQLLCRWRVKHQLERMKGHNNVKKPKQLQIPVRHVSTKMLQIPFKSEIQHALGCKHCLVQTANYIKNILIL